MDPRIVNQIGRENDTNVEDGLNARFDGQVIVVTGASSGIGEATARRLHTEGATVAALDVEPAAIASLAEELTGTLAVTVDVCDRASIDAAFDTIAGAFGHIDGLAHVAGVDASRAIKEQVSAYRNRPEGAERSGFDGVVVMTDEEWRRVLSINLDGTFYCTTAAIRHMIPLGSGAIVTVASMAGVTGSFGLAHYSASKAGVRVFSQSLAREVAGYGIRVNVVAPGPTDTAMLRRMPSASLARAGTIPLGRPGTPAELAASIAFLLSDDASYITGETLNVNGGMLMM